MVQPSGRRAAAWCAAALLWVAAPAAPAVEPSAPPAVALRAARGGLRLEVAAPAGEHLNAAAPASAQVGALELLGQGDLSGALLPIAPAAEARAVRVEVPLCDDAGQRCRIAALTGSLPPGPLPRRLELQPAPPPAVALGRGAVARIYDFSAVWCPPCNQMKVEVLDDPDNAADLAGIDVQVIDVDLPSSWDLKTRYAVGGYPTLVAVDAEGRELSRFLGYPSEAALLGWLGGLGEAGPLDALRAGPPPGVEGAQAAAVARSLAEMGELGPAAAWLAVAPAGSLDYHLAHLALDPSPADADFLTAHAPPGDWLPVVLARWPERWASLAPAVAAAPPALAAWCFSTHAGAAPPEVAAAARWAAVALVDGLVDDDLEESRPHVTWLASLRAEAGDLPGGLALLDRFSRAYPAEFTFEHAAAGLLSEAGRWPEAEARARRGLGLAVGDQRLRAAVVLARALDAQGRRAEAIALLREERAASPRPGPEQKVRTTRYIDAVDAVLKEWGQAP